jgi:hypothetical protein
MTINGLISVLVSDTKNGLSELYRLFESKEYDTIIKILGQFLMIGDYNTLTKIIYDNTILDLIPQHTDVDLYQVLFSIYYSCYHDGLQCNYKKVKQVKVHILKQFVNKPSLTFIKKDFFFSILIGDIIIYIHNRKKRCEFINYIIEYMVKKHYNIYNNIYLFHMGIYTKKCWYCDDYNANKIIRTMV